MFVFRGLVFVTYEFTIENSPIGDLDLSENGGWKQTNIPQMVVKNRELQW